MARRNLFTLVLLGVALALAGCYRQVTRDGWAGVRQFADESSPQAAKHRPGEAAPDGYAIFLANFEGGDRQSKADAYVRRVVSQTRFPDVWVKAVGNRVVVYRGRYSDPLQSAAVQDLDQTRLALVDGDNAFATAAIVPLGEGFEAVTGRYDLRQHSGMYSLQIGYFDEQYGPDFRKAAEKAVDRFREQGEDAFYYHGPNISMITIGLYTIDDVQQEVTKQADGTDVIQPVYSERVLEVQRRYPFNVPNGHVPEQAVAAGPGAELEGGRAPAQPSFLVQVP
jgi:hypothetical protein